MSKEDFKDVLQYGHCSCGNTGTNHICETSGEEPYHCNCCKECQNTCREMNEKLQSILDG